MKTSYFWKATHEPDINSTYVSISRQKMKSAETMIEYPKLMPNWDIIRIAHSMEYNEQSFLLYKEAYFKQLNSLDPQEVYEDLKDCVLVCFESPKDLASGKKFCHRRMVAGWIEEKLGIIVPEETREVDKILTIPTIYENSKTILGR